MSNTSPAFHQAIEQHIQAVDDYLSHFRRLVELGPIGEALLDRFAPPVGRATLINRIEQTKEAMRESVRAMQRAAEEAISNAAPEAVAFYTAVRDVSLFPAVDK